MSGTRSPFQKAPATEALIVSHGQPSDPDPAEDRLRALARRVEPHLPGWRVRSATMAAEGALEQALEDTDGAPLVFPFFMANGWFTRQALPARLGKRHDRILPPLGLSPTLPALAADLLRREANQIGWAVSETDILVAAHGSARGDNPARCTRLFADAVSRLVPFRKIEVGFLEQAPDLSEVARGHGPRSLCIPFFASGGCHVVQDVPDALAEAGYSGRLLGALGQSDLVPALVARTFLTALPKENAA